MFNFRRYTVLLFIFLTFVEQNSLAAESAPPEVCKPWPVENANVKGRAKKIRFPDGREITIVGHVHGNRQIYDVLKKRESGEIEKMSNDQLHTYLKNILAANLKPHNALFLKSYRQSVLAQIKAKTGIDASDIFDSSGGLELETPTVLGHAQSDYQFIKDLVARREVQFIGYEGDQETWNINFKSYIEGAHFLTSQVRKRGGPEALNLDRQDLFHILLSATNGNVFAYINDPTLALRVPMIGTEDPQIVSAHGKCDVLNRMHELKMESNEAEGATQKNLAPAELEQFRKNKEFWKFAIYHGRLYADVENMEINSPTELERRIAFVQALSAPDVYKPYLPKFFELYRERIRHNNERDLHSAKNLVALRKTGVHFVGLNHFNNTLQLIEKLCSQEVNHQTGESGGGKASGRAPQSLLIE